MYVSAELLQKTLQGFQLSLTPEQMERLKTYARLLVEYNEKVNLTAITDPDGIAVKHFADSLALLHYYDIPQNALCADVGTGAGFPGLPLLIVRPDLRLRFFDSTKKKLQFIEMVLKELDLSGETVHLRAEEAGHDKRFRGRFAVVTARAVADLRILAELCVPLLQEGGVFLAMKGDPSPEELACGEQALKQLGAQLFAKESYLLPPADKRSLLLSKKISQTSTKYPRSFSQISKNPL